MDESFLKGAESIRLNSLPRAPPNITCTHLLFPPTSIAFSTGPGAYLAKKSTDNGKKKDGHDMSSHAPSLPQRFPTPFLRMVEQTGHTIIDTHYVLGIFGTATWTNGARACALRFAFFWFNRVLIVVGDDGKTERDWRTGCCCCCVNLYFCAFDLLGNFEI